eukprot:TRINITY_DN9271_c0_g1_i1.p1 TRINITY_DN9271_c0_g1~~TRINITY_DN9271_c0_g1_i1.p1  ORF type:complete len:616 (+),score=146.32 TRINITY_DN9271_c0_g1_i1:33-1850(+)
MASTLSLILLGLALVALVSAQACHLQSSRISQELYDVAHVNNCMNLVPADGHIVNATIDTVTKALQSYAFRDAVRDSPPSDHLLHISVDLLKQLPILQNTAWSSDIEFHNALTELFVSLKDPHTVYSGPQCYGSFAVQPFALTSSWDEATSTQSVEISGIYAFAEYKNSWPELTNEEYTGATIVEIDGVDAVKAITDFALEFGFVSKDPSVLFNDALAHGFTQIPAVLYELPTKPRVYSLKLKDGTSRDLTLDWQVFATSDFNYGPAGCGDRRFKRDVSEEKTFNPLTFHRLPSDATGASPVDQDPGDSIEFYIVNDETAALRISSFAPRDDRAFLEIVDKMLEYAGQKAMPNLIIDLRGNGGGSIPLGYQVIHRLVNERHPEGDYDMIHSPLNSLFAKAAAANPSLGIPDFSPLYWSNPEGQSFTNISWYDPGETYVRGGISGQYSGRNYSPTKFATVFPQHLFKKILLVSDGLCGSTCAVFSSHLDEVDHVDSVSIGGIYPQPQAFFSFPGGQVVSMDFVTQLARALRVSTNPEVPDQLPTSGRVSWTLLEIYPWLAGKAAEIPAEFLFRPALHRLPLWLPAKLTDDQKEELYTSVHNLFQKD